MIPQTVQSLPCREEPQLALGAPGFHLAQPKLLRALGSELGDVGSLPFLTGSH